MIKKVLALLLCVWIFGSSVKTMAAANPFSDMPADHWAYDFVTQLATLGINEGYGDSTFRGQKNITRYEVAAMLAKTIKKVFNVSITSNEEMFSDVPEGHWAYDSVAMLVKAGVSKGYGDGTFRGDKNITRYEVAMMIANISKQKFHEVPEIANPFSDLPSNHWAKEAVTILAAKGINQGYGDGTFLGNKNITRYEMATMLAKTLNALLKS